MPQILTLDFETYYDREYSLSKLTTEAYVRDFRFETIGLAFKVGDGPTTWVSKPSVAQWVKSMDWSDKIVVCQNTAFDGAILAWHYGVTPLAWADTLGMSRALHPHEKSHSLAAQATRLGIGAKGDEVNNALGKHYDDFSVDELARYAAYCVNDVNLTHQIFTTYLQQGFPKQELKLIDLTLRMFIEPRLVLDKELLVGHLQNVREHKQQLLDAVRDQLINADPDSAATTATEDIKKLLMSNEKFAGLLRELGVEPPMKISATTGKEAYAFAKTDEAFKALEEHSDPRVQALVAARLGNKTTLEETRTETLIDYASRGLFPIALRYYGAATGRWSAESSAKVNMQNLPRTSKIKYAVKPPEGFVVCGADLSNIELRLGLWLAEQEDKLDLIRNGLDLYKEFAKDVFRTSYDEVTKTQRQVGKVSNLSLIYGTGAKKLREAIRIIGGVNLTLEEVTPIVPVYRTSYCRVVEAWGQGEQALNAMINDQRMPLFRGVCVVEGNKGIKLPSGLYLRYPNLRRAVSSATGKAEWVFDSKYGPERMYGAKVFQACTQAAARCIMADGLLRIQKWAPVVLTVHDSAYWLAKREEAETSLAKGVACITRPVTYCPGLPLAAEGGYGDSYGDC